MSNSIFLIAHRLPQTDFESKPNFMSFRNHTESSKCGHAKYVLNLIMNEEYSMVGILMLLEYTKLAAFRASNRLRNKITHARTHKILRTKNTSKIDTLFYFIFNLYNTEE